MDSFFDFVIRKLMIPVMLIIFIVGFFFGIPYCLISAYREAKKPTFELIKADWSCTKEYEYITTSMVMSGKVMVPITTTHHDCIQWSHK